MPTGFKRVPAIDKCHAILKYLSRSEKPRGISEIAGALGLNKSTVFNLVHTMADLRMLETGEGKFRLGVEFYLLAKQSEDSSDLIRIIHPYLGQVRDKTNLSVFLGMRSGMRAVIIDKADSPVDLKISSEIGISIPILAGAAGKALLCQLSRPELKSLLDNISDAKMKRYTGGVRADYLKNLEKVKEGGFALDWGRYIAGIRAMAVPLYVNKPNQQLAIWAVGLENQLREEHVEAFTEALREAAKRVESHFPGQNQGR